MKETARISVKELEVGFNICEKFVLVLQLQKLFCSSFYWILSFK